MKKFQITISDSYENDIKDYTNIHIDDEGIVWYLFSYEGGKISEWEPVGTIKEESTEWISTQDYLPKEDSDVFFLVSFYVNGENYATLPCTGYFLDGKFYDDTDSEYDHTPWNGEKSNKTVKVVEYWLPQPNLPSSKK